jgi:hypothetical protein
MNTFKYYLLLVITSLPVFQNSNAQTFSTAHDTLYGNAYQCPSFSNLDNPITNPSSSSININWKVVASNFPADWLPNFGIIDPSTAYSNIGLGLWNGTTGAMHTAPYPAAASGTFAFSLNTSGLTTTGAFWVEVQLKDAASAYNKNIWFVIARDPSTIVGPLSGAPDVCVGAATTLTDPMPGGAWTAANGNVTVSGGLVNGVTAGTDIITYTASNSCGFTAFTTKTLTINPLPTPVISGGGGRLGTTSSYTAYQWLLTGTPILGATGSFYSPTANGAYSVRVTDINGCSGVSAPVYDANVGVSNVGTSVNDIRIYPNPTRSIINMASSGKINAKLTTMDGRIIMEKQDADEFNLSNIANGIYLLYIYDNPTGIKVKTEKIIKLAE